MGWKRHELKPLVKRLSSNWKSLECDSTRMNAELRNAGKNNASTGLHRIPNPSP